MTLRFQLRRMLAAVLAVTLLFQTRLTLFAGPATQPASESEELAHFKWHGKPIHPGCVWEFEHWLSDPSLDPPRVLEVDIESCANSNRDSKSPEVHPDGWITAHSSDERSMDWFSYRHLEETSNCIHILEVKSGGEGSLVATSIYLLRFGSADYFTLSNGGEPNPQTRLTLRCIGQIGIGDRDDGRIELRGNTVILGKSRNRDLPQKYILP